MEIHIADSAPGITQVRLDDKSNVSYLAEKRDGDSILFYGIGKKSIDRVRLSEIYRGIVAEAERLELDEIVLDYDDVAGFLHTNLDAGYLLGLNLQLASYRPGKHKKPPEDYAGLRVVHIVGEEDEDRVMYGAKVGQGTNECRELVDDPSNILTPSALLRYAQSLAVGSQAHVGSMSHDILKADLGLLYAVGKGSPNKPELIEVFYNGGPEGQEPIVLVGKGITLDTGGTDLKLSGAIQGMHKDMAGGAAAIMAVITAARTGMPVNAVAVVPAAENLMSSTSYRTNDIILGLDGRTVLVRNTDAEGRLVLADGVAHGIRKWKPAAIVTIATLTNAVRMALGSAYTGLFSSDQSFVKLLQRLGAETGNPVWHMPHEGYEKLLKCDTADIANLSLGGNTDGGACIAAAFIAEAVKAAGFTGRFAHLDVAGTAMEASGADGLRKGAATGTPVPLLVELLRQHAMAS